MYERYVDGLFQVYILWTQKPCIRDLCLEKSGIVVQQSGKPIKLTTVFSSRHIV